MIIKTIVKSEYIDLFMGFAVDCSKKSTSLKRKVGAVIINDNNCISTGWNGTLPGLPNECEDSEGHTKPDVCHAEENAILKLARARGGGEGSSIFCTCAPCAICSRLIINSGIKEAFFLEVYKNDEGLNNLIRSNVSVYQLIPDNAGSYIIRVIHKGATE